jgi:hypothetical protein
VLSDVLTHFIYCHYIWIVLSDMHSLFVENFFAGVKLWVKVLNGGTTSINWIEVDFFLILHISLYSTCWN